MKHASGARGGGGVTAQLAHSRRHSDILASEAGRILLGERPDLGLAVPNRGVFLGELGLLVLGEGVGIIDELLQVLLRAHGLRRADTGLVGEYLGGRRRGDRVLVGLHRRNPEGHGSGREDGVDDHRMESTA
jgi:hypothetical protein